MHELEKVLKKALSLGADEAELFFSSSSGYSFSSRGREIVVKQHNSEQGYGLRVLKKKKLGFAHFARLQDAEKAAKTSISLARHSEETPFSFPGKTSYSKADCFDTRVAALDENWGVSQMKEMTSALAENAKPTECGLGYGFEEVFICNSNGLDVTEGYSEIGGSASGHYKGSSCGHGKADSHLSFEPREIGLEAGKRAKEMHGSKPKAVGKTDVVMDIEAIQAFVSGLLMKSFDGDNVRQGGSALSKKFLQHVFDDRASIFDDPMANGPRKSSFDSEGIASKRKALVKKGIVNAFLFDLRTQSLSKGTNFSPEPGNAHRSGFTQPPGVGRSNIVIEVSEGTNDVVRECNKGVYLRSFFGLHTSNKVTGDFSVSVDEAFEIKNGEKTTPIRGVMLSGNIFSMLECIKAAERKSNTFYEVTSPRLLLSGAVLM